MTSWVKASFLIAPRIAPYIYLEGVSFQFDDNDLTDTFNAYIYIGFDFSYHIAK